MVRRAFENGAPILMLSPELSVILSNLDFLSPDGICHNFGRRANGYARGEGVVAIVLKPIKAAVRDGDVIRAVIRTSGCYQDSKGPILTQPSVQSQEALIRQLYEKSQHRIGVH